MKHNLTDFVKEREDIIIEEPLALEEVTDIRKYNLKERVTKRLNEAIAKSSERGNTAAEIIVPNKNALDPGLTSVYYEFTKAGYVIRPSQKISGKYTGIAVIWDDYVLNKTFKEVLPELCQSFKEVTFNYWGISVYSYQCTPIPSKRRIEIKGTIRLARTEPEPILTFNTEDASYVCSDSFYKERAESTANTISISSDILSAIYKGLLDKEEIRKEHTKRKD